MELIHITEVLRLYQNKNPRVLQGSLVEEVYFERGSAVHLFCSNYAKNLWGFLPEEYKGYAESFMNWFDKYVVKVYFVEETFDNLDLGITGQPDLGCLLRDEKFGILADLKTSAITQRWWLSQNAAYLHLVQKKYPMITRAGALKLDKDGKTAKFIPCDVPQEAFSAFLSALNAYRYFKERR